MDISVLTNLVVDRKGRPKIELADFFVEITKKLNNGRPVLSVYNHIRRIYHPGNYSGKWSESEDNTLKRHATLKPITLLVI
jgi:hypothetical protein